MEKSVASNNGLVSKAYMCQLIPARSAAADRSGRRKFGRIYRRLCIERPFAAFATWTVFLGDGLLGARERTTLLSD
jgi:hypothetical protein